MDCLKEVKILQNLEHPNIVKCYNSFIQVRRPWRRSPGGRRMCTPHSPHLNRAPPPVRVAGQRAHHRAGVGRGGRPQHAAAVARAGGQAVCARPSVEHVQPGGHALVGSGLGGREWGASATPTRDACQCGGVGPARAGVLGVETHARAAHDAQRPQGEGSWRARCRGSCAHTSGPGRTEAVCVGRTLLAAARQHLCDGGRGAQAGGPGPQPLLQLAHAAGAHHGCVDVPYGGPGAGQLHRDKRPPPNLRQPACCPAVGDADSVLGL